MRWNERLRAPRLTPPLRCRANPLLEPNRVQGGEGGALTPPAPTFEHARELARVTHDDDVTGVVFSPDGGWLATCSDDNTARVWDSASGRELARLTHDSRVERLVFSPDGGRLATASERPRGDNARSSSGAGVSALVTDALAGTRKPRAPLAGERAGRARCLAGSTRSSRPN